jgi:hypothetical protein
MKPVRFSIIGGGWRAHFYLRLAKMLPHLFEVSGVYVRDSDKRQQLQAAWNVNTPSTLDKLLNASDADFIVLSISKQAVAPMLLELASTSIPILAETPPAANLEQLLHLVANMPANARIQVAEQYPFYPHNQARTSLLAAGMLGEPVHLQVSAGHGYHGMSLIRRWLALGNEECTITGQRFESSIMEGPYREQLPQEERFVASSQDVALFQFEGGRSAVFDFTREQYFSPIRQNRVLIRGIKGEIIDNRAYYMADFETPIQGKFTRIQSGGEGSLGPLSLEGIVFEGDWLYRNPVHPTAFTDEELAMTQVLLHMADYARQGISTYSFMDACLDTYLAFMMDEAIHTGHRVVADLSFIRK